MKKGICVLLVMVSVCFLCNVAWAFGARMAGPHMLTCDPTPEQIAGMYVYWRLQGGTWSDANRVQTGDISKTPIDILSFLKVNGKYELVASYFTAAGDESDLSNIVPFERAIPGAPRIYVQ